MSAKSEFLWRLVTEVQSLEELAAKAPGDRCMSLVAIELRKLYELSERLPASHDLFRRFRTTKGDGTSTSGDLTLSPVPSEAAPARPSRGSEPH